MSMIERAAREYFTACREGDVVFCKATLTEILAAHLKETSHG